MYAMLSNVYPKAVTRASLLCHARSQRVVQLKKEDEEAREKLSKNFALGKEAYACGEYPASVKLLEVSQPGAGHMYGHGGHLHSLAQKGMLYTDR